jgi:FkbM family methyltransferase
MPGPSPRLTVVVSEVSVITLDEDMRVYAASKLEARYIYDEIFQADCYGVTELPDRPFVIDVGANIGLFALFVKRRYPAAEILAFEPMPQSAELLRRNLALHEVGSVVVHEVALGRAPETAAPFVFYPRIPGNSTRHPEVKVEAMAQLGETMPAKMVERLYRGRAVTADVERLSAFLPAKRGIDLLKIDVEGAELDVLLGIDEGHWPLVRRVVAEVHDQDGRVDSVCELLHGHGFDPAVRPAGGPAQLVDARRTGYGG